MAILDHKEAPLHVCGSVFNREVLDNLFLSRKQELVCDPNLQLLDGLFLKCVSQTSVTKESIPIDNFDLSYDISLFPGKLYTK